MWILTYHSISAGPPPLCVAPDRFAAQLDQLLEQGWRAVPISAALAGAAGTGETGGKDDGGPRFAVSFDDGYRDFVDAALPILEQRSVPATLFATAAPDRDQLPGGLAGRALLEPAQLREVAARGVELGGHGVRHCALPRLAEPELRTELRDGRARLADWTEAEVRYFAYPFGAFDGRVLEAASAEYHAAFTTQLAAVPAAPHLHAIPRIDAHYLDRGGLLEAASRGSAARWLTLRRWLRRLRGSEPRRPVPLRTQARGDWAWA